MKKTVIHEFFRLRQLSGIIQENNISNDVLQHIMKGYITAAIWTEEERLKEESGQSFEQEYDEMDATDFENTELDHLVKIQANMNNQSFDSFSENNIDADSLIQAYNDIKTFISNVNPEFIHIAIKEQGAERLGHDIWLTRNHHGAGFFDHSYDYDMEQALTKAAQELKEVNLYIGDDYMLHFDNA